MSQSGKPFNQGMLIAGSLIMCLQPASELAPAYMYMLAICAAVFGGVFLERWGSCIKGSLRLVSGEQGSAGHRGGPQDGLGAPAMMSASVNGE
eukprot:53859-Pelagomonas_calceolata.AAC.4